MFGLEFAKVGQAVFGSRPNELVAEGKRKIECINHPPGGAQSTKLCFTQLYDISDAP